MYEILLVGTGGMAGAVARYAVTKALVADSSSPFPLPTFIVNMVGSFGFGFFLAMVSDRYLLLFIGTGFLGAFTTFSTFSLEGIQLLKAGKRKTFWFYVVSSVMVGVALAGLGFRLGWLLN